MRAKQIDGKLILQDAPGCLWLFGAFFVLVGGVFVYGSLGGFTDYDRVPWWAIALSFFMGAIAVSVGIWQIALHPSSKAIINSRTKTVLYARSGLFGKTERILRFGEIRRFSVEKSEDDEGNPLWRLELNLTSGETVELTSVWERNEEKCEAVAARANEFLKS